MRKNLLKILSTIEIIYFAYKNACHAHSLISILLEPKTRAKQKLLLKWFQKLLLFRSKIDISDNDSSVIKPQAKPKWVTNSLNLDLKNKFLPGFLKWITRMWEFFLEIQSNPICIWRQKKEKKFFFR